MLDVSLICQYKVMFTPSFLVGYLLCYIWMSARGDDVLIEVKVRGLGSRQALASEQDYLSSTHGFGCVGGRITI